MSDRSTPPGDPWRDQVIRLEAELDDLERLWVEAKARARDAGRAYAAKESALRDAIRAWSVPLPLFDGLDLSDPPPLPGPLPPAPSTNGHAGPQETLLINLEGMPPHPRRLLSQVGIDTVEE